MPRVEALPDEELARPRRRGEPVWPALRTTDMELEGPVGLGDQIAAEEVRLRRVTEGLVQVGVVRPVVHVPVRAGCLYRDVEEAGGAFVAGDAVDRGAVDPGLEVHEVGVVTAELAAR